MKTPLVLISGLLSNESLWKHQRDHLGDVALISVICPSEDTPEKMVRGILDKAPPKFALAGHSMGGWLCLEIMRKDPSRVSKLCLLNTTARMDSIDKRSRREKMIREAEKGEFPRIVEEIADRFVFNLSVKDDVKKMFLQVGKEAFIRQEKAMILRKESASILPKIHCPTLVIHADRDQNFSLEESEELASQIQGAELAIVENAGHMSPMEAPQAITGFLRSWLAYDNA